MGEEQVRALLSCCLGPCRLRQIDLSCVNLSSVPGDLLALVGLLPSTTLLLPILLPFLLPLLLLPPSTAPLPQANPPTRGAIL